MRINNWNLAFVGDAALIAAGVLAARYSPQLDPLAIACAVLLARFRGRGQALSGAIAFSLVMLASAIGRPGFVHSPAGLVQHAAVMWALWICTFSVLSAKQEATSAEESEKRIHTGDGVWDAVKKIVPGWVWAARRDERFPGFLWKALPDGKVTYINRYCEDYLGLTAEETAADWGALSIRMIAMRS